MKKLFLLLICSAILGTTLDGCMTSKPGHKRKGHAKKTVSRRNFCSANQGAYDWSLGGH